MSYSFTQWAAIVALGLVFLLWRELETLRKQLGAQDLKPMKKRWKAFNAERRTPQHKPDQVPQNASDDDRRFFRDFAGTADYLNEMYDNSPFSFENTGKLETSGGFGSAERTIKIWHGQLPSGFIQISCGNYSKEDLPNFQVRVRLSLVNARFLSGNEVLGLATEVSRIVMGDGSDLTRLWMETNILRTMMDAVWRTGEESILTPIVDFDFAGLPPDWYLRRMKQLREQR